MKRPKKRNVKVLILETFKWRAQLQRHKEKRDKPNPEKVVKFTKIDNGQYRCNTCGSC